MATIPDSVKAQLDADWSGAGGAEPTYYVEKDIRTNPPTGQDYIFILSSTLDTDPVPFNDTFVNEKHVLEIVTNTLTSEDRLKEIGDEVVRILNTTAITDMTYQRYKKRKITSGVDKGVFNYQEVITYDLQEQMKSSTASYGAGAGLQLDDLLMFGAAHAAWYPCTFDGWNGTEVDGGGAGYRNFNAANGVWTFLLPLPTTKGGLKLYVNGIRLGVADADATNYVDRTRVFGVDHTLGVDTLYDETDNLNSAAAYESDDNMDAWGAATDVSGYDEIKAYISTTVNAQYALDVQFIQMKCYYAT